MVKETVKEKKRKIKSRKLPPGVDQDDYGYYMMAPTGDDTDALKRIEVVFHPNPDEGRAIANRRDAYYWDEENGIMMYRGIKAIIPGAGPEPIIRPDGLYTMNYPGYQPHRPRRVVGMQKTGKTKYLVPYAKDEEEGRVGSPPPPLEQFTEEDEDE